MNNFRSTAALSTWNLERGAATTSREVTLVDSIEGTELIYEVITTPATNFRVGMRGTVSVLKNVTDIRHISEQLARGEQRLQTAEEEVRIERDRLDLVLRNVPNPIIVIDNDNQIVSMNAAAQRLFGAQPGSGRGPQIAVANDARFTSVLAALRLEPASERRGEIVVTDPESEERLEMHVQATEVRDTRGAVVATVSVMQDVGRLRELERRRLEQVLFDSEKLAATGRLAASIAHEINNPLEAVQNALYLLQKELGADANNRQYLDIASRETQRMSRILRQMLGFYRQQEVMGEIDLNALVEEAGALVAKRLRERGVQIATQLDPALPRIRAAADQLKGLVVDDEESVVVTIKAILQLDGYNVATTTSGVQARAMVRDVEYDLVLTDLRLEDGDGLDVLKAVRENHPETITIMLTGYASLESAIQAIRAGACDYPVKPSEVEELRSTVARGIERRRLGQELRARVIELERANREIANLNSITRARSS